MPRTGDDTVTPPGNSGIAHDGVVGVEGQVFTVWRDYSQPATAAAVAILTRMAVSALIGLCRGGPGRCHARLEQGLFDVLAAI